jgi:FkbM family methyltransferase
MSNQVRPSVASRVLHALGLARAAEVEQQRRRARDIRDKAREREQRHDAAAQARLQSMERQLRAEIDAEHAARVESDERLRALGERLTATEQELVESLAALRRLKTIHDSHEGRVLSQLRLGAEAARQPVAADAAAREALLRDRSSAYAEVATAWQGGHRPAGVRRTSIAGLCWSVPLDGGEQGSLARRIIDQGWLPLDDLAGIRQFAVGGVMLDIGANIGTTSIPRAVLRDFATVYAAEPNTENYECLVGNVLDNHLAGRVLPDRVAISSSSGTMRLKRSKKIGGHQLVGSDKPDPAEFEEVPCFTIDAWIDRLSIPARDVRFVKVDTQGWDLHVLQGATQLLERRDVTWQIEVSPGLMKGAGSTIAELCALAAAHFTHVKELRGYSGGGARPAAQLQAMIEALPENRRFANLLLFNMA